jgi:predicted DNA-binding antitoxin AbrB/MazE fold protein
MAQVTEAIFVHGVLKPVEELSLRENQRVRLIVEALTDEPKNREAALKKLRAGIAEMQFCSKGKLPSRDELHDRV